MSAKDHKRDLSPGEKGSFCLGFLVIMLLFCSACPPPISARTWYIKADGTGDAPTIQAGVDSAAAGDTVLVGPGTYSDTTYVQIFSSPVPVNVHVNKNIVLTGEYPPPSVTINGAYSATAVFIHGVDSTATVRWMRIRRIDPTIYCILDRNTGEFEVPAQHEDVGIFCRNGSPCIEENELVDLGYGVRIEGGSPRVQANTFLRTFAGVSVTGSTTAEISGNHFDTFYVGVGGSGCSPRVIGNEMVGHGNSCNGINLYDATPYISHNLIRNVEYDAIRFRNSRATIEYNRIEWIAYDGVYLLACDYSVVRYNTFIWSDTGIFLDSSFHTAVENNTIQYGVDGIEVTPYCDPIIRNNIITGVTSGIGCWEYSVPTIECNDVYDVLTWLYRGCGNQTGLNGNISVDPEFCGIDGSGNYYLQADSPCAPGNHPDGYDCGLIGAYEVNCGDVKAAQKSWGAIKSLYRKAREDRD